MRRAAALMVAAAAFAALAILWIVTDRRAAQRIYDEYSVANTSGKGLSLAYGYLAKRHKVAMLTRPLSRAPIERDAVIFRVVTTIELRFDPEDLEGEQFGPPRPRAEALLNTSEEAFVRGGGRLIIAAPWSELPTLETSEKVAKKVFPIWPEVADLDLPASSFGFSSLRSRMHTLFASGALAIIARERIGDGEFFLISAPALFRNDGLARGNHLQLLNALADTKALAGTNRAIYFDEVPHAIVSGDGSLALLKDWNLGPFLLLLGVVALLVFWRGGRRIGEAEDDYRDVRSEAVDLVRSLGALYHSVTTDAEAIALYHAALTRSVASQTGLRGDALRKRVDELTGGFVPPRHVAHMPAAIFSRDLNTLNEAFSQAVKRRRNDAIDPGHRP